MRVLSAIAILGLISSTPASAAEAWQQEIATGLGKPGTEMPGGVYRVALPRTDLKVTLDGVAIKPALALGFMAGVQTDGKRRDGHGRSRPDR